MEHCSIAAVVRELVFTMDTELLPTPTLNPDNNQALFKYLKDVSKKFSIRHICIKI